MITCLLLAAGSSSRMGKPKMLLPYRGKTFLQHIIDEVRQANDGKLLVITGCYHTELQQVLIPQQIELVENKQWEAGMGSSIQTGIRYISAQYKETTDVIIMVCDQPFISTALLKQMSETKQTASKGIIACSYDNTLGTPVLFDQKYFTELSLLNGQQGAKKIIQQHATDIASIDFPEGSIDIDLPGEYEQLLAAEIKQPL